MIITVELSLCSRRKKKIDGSETLPMPVRGGVAILVGGGAVGTPAGGLTAAGAGVASIFT